MSEPSTVIGPAVNMASRLETLTKQLGRTVLLSRAFADFVESDFDLERVGDSEIQDYDGKLKYRIFWYKKRNVESSIEDIGRRLDSGNGMVNQQISELK